MEAELVSIIIATRNPGKQLQRCINSIESQSHAAREIIVIDAGSTDTTAAYLESISGRLFYWESKPDEGIYHAWNKGLMHTRGKWICFLGADDEFASRESLAILVDIALSSNAVLATGRALLVDGSGLELHEIGQPWDWRRLRVQQEIVHVGALHHRDLFSRYGNFDSTLKIAGDYDFLLRLPEDARVAFVPSVVVRMGDGGISRANPDKVFRETLIVQKRKAEIGSIRAYRNYLWKRLKLYVRRLT